MGRQAIPFGWKSERGQKEHIDSRSFICQCCDPTCPECRRFYERDDYKYGNGFDSNRGIPDGLDLLDDEEEYERD